jgi:hypothetical protein
MKGICVLVRFDSDFAVPRVRHQMRVHCPFEDANSSISVSGYVSFSNSPDARHVLASFRVFTSEGLIPAGQTDEESQGQSIATAPGHSV